MKYLNKIFESKTMLDTNILGDILQEITDLGYLSRVDSSWWSDNRGNDISICIYGKSEYDEKLGFRTNVIYTNEVIEVIERLVDFLKSEGYTAVVDTIKTIDAIKNKPIHTNKNIITIKNKIEFKFDNKINDYKISRSISLYFKQ